MNKEKGLLIVIEGVDGVGKTTAIRSAVAQLKAMGYDVAATGETMTNVEGLDNTFGAALFNMIKLQSTQEQADPTSQSLMIASARRAHYRNVLKLLLNAGKIVVMDRFFLSTYYNYQSECLKNGQIYALAMGTFKPDYTVVLRADPKVAEQRIQQRGAALDCTDHSALTRFAQIQNSLLSYVRNNPGFVIDANREADIVATDLVDQILYAADELRG